MQRTAGRDPRDRATAPRVCDRPDCTEPGLHPAPKSHDRLHDYFWFCKEHAREYNAAWNYCKGLGPAEIDRLIRQDTVWGRPTWPLGMQVRARRGQAEFRTEDRSGLFDEDAFHGGRDHVEPDAPAGSEPWAMRVLELSHPLTLTVLKARYKELAKLLHPDVNGGDTEAEERLKRINLAYATLRASLSGA